VIWRCCCCLCSCHW